MQFVRYTYQGSRPQWGVVEDGDVYALADLPAGEPDYADLAAPGYRESVAGRIATGVPGGVPEADVRRLAPVPRPGKMVCVGMNYRDHAEEKGESIPSAPLLFSKAPTAVTNPGDPVYDPPAVEALDYEAELGVVVGRTAAGVSEDEALDYVAGYTAINDVTARDAQDADGQFLRAKSYDTFGPMGPRLVSGDFDPHAAAIESRVDGDVRQSSNTSQFIFDVAELLAYVSDVMTLRPGDVLSTGTPGGVGKYTPDGLLSPGDQVAVEIEGIGTLTNPVVEEP